MSIRDWPAQERPREKLLLQGAAALSDAELLAIFLRTGVAGRSAVDLARHLLAEFGGLRPLLDAGCGTGSDVLKIAEKVGISGKVIGVDASESMIAESRRRAEGTPLPVEFRTSDVQHLDFPDNTFNACRADRIFVHLSNPAQALSEMIRVWWYS